MQRWSRGQVVWRCELSRSFLWLFFIFTATNLHLLSRVCHHSCTSSKGCLLLLLEDRSFHFSWLSSALFEVMLLEPCDFHIEDYEPQKKALSELHDAFGGSRVLSPQARNSLSPVVLFIMKIPLLWAAQLAFQCLWYGWMYPWYYSISSPLLHGAAPALSTFHFSTETNM